MIVYELEYPFNGTGNFGGAQVLRKKREREREIVAEGDIAETL